MPNNTLERYQQLAPGLSVIVIVGFAAMFLSTHYGTPVMLFALLLGIAISFLYEETKCKQGIDFAAVHLLQIGVGLIGMRLMLSDVFALGWNAALLLVSAIISTMLLGQLLSRLIGLPKQFGILTGGAVGICGASAALAISSVLPDYKNKDRDTILTVIGVTLLSTLAMVVYPMLASALELSMFETSFFLGGTIHDVAQVVGAGYSVSIGTGDMATLVKLIRVSLLVPVIFALIIILRTNKGTQTQAPKLPRFLVMFVVLMLLNTFVEIPSFIAKTTSDISRFALVLAMVAIGMKSNLRQLLEVGIKPVAILAIETAWIAGLIIVGLRFI